MSQEVRDDIPASTKTMIVFPWLEASKEFDKKVYTPEMTDNRATTEQVHQFLDIMTNIVKEKHYTETFKAAIALLKISAPLALVLYLFEGTLNITVRNVILFFFAWASAWFLAHLLNQQRKKSNSERIKQQLKTAFEKHSLESLYKAFDKKGLRWKIPAQFPYWIELYKDYEKEDKPEETDKAKNTSKEIKESKKTS